MKFSMSAKMIYQDLTSKNYGTGTRSFSSSNQFRTRMETHLGPALAIADYCSTVQLLPRETLQARGLQSTFSAQSGQIPCVKVTSECSARYTSILLQ